MVWEVQSIPPLFKNCAGSYITCLRERGFILVLSRDYESLREDSGMQLLDVSMGLQEDSNIMEGKAF